MSGWLGCVGSKLALRNDCDFTLSRPIVGLDFNTGKCVPNDAKEEGE